MFIYKWIIREHLKTNMKFKDNLFKVYILSITNIKPGIVLTLKIICIMII